MESALTASFKLNVLKIFGINDTQYVKDAISLPAILWEK